MSLQPRRLQEVPEEPARIAHTVFMNGNVSMRLRDELGTLDEDADVAALCPAVGQPA